MPTILIIDDRPHPRAPLRAVLGARGDRVLEAGGGAAALALARAERPDLVIAELLNPPTDASDLLRRLRADPRLAGTPLILSVPRGREAEASRLGLAHGAAAVITDEAEPAAILRAVRGALGLQPEPPPRAAAEPEAESRQAQKMEAIGRLAGGIAHDFNNLLTVINTCSDLLLRSLPAGESAQDLAAEIHKAGQRAASLTRQLLAFSRKSGVEPRLIDLGAVVADTGRMLRRIVGEDIELSVAREPDAGTVWADPGQIEQVVLNLVVNARDAVARGGKIAVGVANAELDEAAARALPGARPGPHVLLAVSDTGCGMDAATAARAFEPFFTTKGASGTGLGLATVQAVVRGCGGAVAVETEPGRGTTFRVYLPRATDPAPGDVPQRGAEAMQRGNGTVLVVEDEAAVRTIVRHVLTGCGYAVLEAADGAEAVRVAAAHSGRLDVIVSDVVLPDLGGREVVARVAASHPEAKVLFVSGYDEGSLDRYGVPEARAAFLQKPFTPATLTAKVREVMEASPA